MKRLTLKKMKENTTKIPILVYTRLCILKE